jgi:3-methyladenine DNA glycosylase AlkD
MRCPTDARPAERHEEDGQRSAGKAEVGLCSGQVNAWDLVDRSAHQVLGAWLLDKPRDVLHQLARSPRWWERRIAVFATLAFVRKGDLDDTFALAELLVHDEHDLVRRVVGGMLREAGKHDRARLLGFLDAHAATAPRVLLRDAIEHLDPQHRAHYLNLKPRGGRALS